jgi:Type II CAAX prenyl endopeptidase Rce1-like
VTLRSRALCLPVAIVSGFLGFVFLLAAAVPDDRSASNDALVAVIGLAMALVCLRVARAGLQLESQRITVRGLSTTQTLTRAEVAGLAVQRFARDKLMRLAVVGTDGTVVPVVWSVTRATNQPWLAKAVYAASGFGVTQEQVTADLDGAGRLAGQESLPVATADPGLTPATVEAADASGPTRWLGWETVFLIVAFALPGVAGAVVILAQHLGGVSDLDEFSLPLPHHVGVSFFLLLLDYSTTALIVPIALLLLARTGQPPKSLGLQVAGWRPDAFGGVGLLAGVWVANLIALIPLSFVLNNKHLTNTASNTHVPAYYVIYGLTLAATTAINEEVLVNGYFLTRLSQLGWSPRRAFALSLAVRTSYHVYYGVGLILTVPFGYLVTRSFQKRRRLLRPIFAHFLYDAILITIAVLTS